MTILNIMLGRKRGGLEQAAIDYAEALALTGRPTLTVLHSEGWARQEFSDRNLPYVTLDTLGMWDVFSMWKLRRIAIDARAQAAICHGNRALSMALWALRSIPIIAVSHNYQTKRFARADACFTITRHAFETLAAEGIGHQRLFPMPNMVRMGPAPQRTGMRHPPVIGSMGRFVGKKGFDVLIEALAELDRRGVAFRAILGGGGDQEDLLRRRITRYGLDEKIALPGWVQDKDAFFASLDLFVLPSHHEPFGIVLTEAMAAAVPVVSTASEGPREILSANETGLLTPVGDATALADAMQKLLADPALALQLGQAGRATVTQHYTPEAMARRLDEALATILTGN